MMGRQQVHGQGSGLPHLQALAVAGGHERPLGNPVWWATRAVLVTLFAVCSRPPRPVAAEGWAGAAADRRQPWPLQPTPAPPAPLAAHLASMSEITASWPRRRNVPLLVRTLSTLCLPVSVSTTLRQHSTQQRVGQRGAGRHAALQLAAPGGAFSLPQPALLAHPERAMVGSASLMM